MQDKSQEELWLSNHHLNYHRRQFDEPYRSTVHLAKFIESVLLDTRQSYKAIDVGCGAGANIYHLSKLLVNTSWVGLDISEPTFELGRSIMKGKKATIPVEFIKGDFYYLSDLFPPRSFELVFSIQTLSWLPSYEQALTQLLHISKRFVFVTSLFTDFPVDARIEITQYGEQVKWKGDGPYFYNVYCFERFQDFCMEHGAKKVIAIDFQMDIDLPPPSPRQMGTYTCRLQDGTRLQLSGPLLMPWKFIAIWMGEV